MAKRMEVNPTRMELMNLRDRLGIATHGHSLLKDKLEGLMAEFMERVDEYRSVRKDFNNDYPEVVRLFLLAGITGSRENIQDAIKQNQTRLRLDIRRDNIFGIDVPVFDSSVEPGQGYSLLDTPLELDEAMQSMEDFLPRILELSEREHTLWKMIKEIERTRRRVNALEYIMIPQLRETIKYIQTKLDENDRENITRLMKIKDMRLQEERQKNRQQQEQKAS
jgi:V/A-type H+-transporting ATPase subunit D